jgi:hypothetical protein
MDPIGSYYLKGCQVWFKAKNLPYYEWNDLKDVGKAGMNVWISVSLGT